MLGPSCGIAYGLMRVDESQVHDDYYVLADHDLVVHTVVVVSVTSNKQLICQFHKLLVRNGQ